jgi:23S rRNA G2445 N2-methylase RlmL
MKKLQIQMNGRSDEFQTPKEAIFPLLPYIDTREVIWECAWGEGSLAKHFKEKGFKVVKTNDFFTEEPEHFNVIITNPPYSKKYEFLKRAYELRKPFAFLMPLSALEGKKRGELYRKYGIQLIIPNKRINFITPSGKGSGAWFQVAWFCYGWNLPKDLMFVELKKPLKEKK